MSSRIELYKQHSLKQENYTYYIIALSVTAIGYAIHSTSGIGFAYSQILLGIAVLFWSLSVFLGIRFIRDVISTIYMNMGAMDVAEGRFSEVGNHPVMKNEAYKVAMEMVNEKGEKASWKGRWQKRLFFLGIIAFIIWHLYEMYLLSI